MGDPFDRGAILGSGCRMLVFSKVDLSFRAAKIGYFFSKYGNIRKDMKCVIP